MRPNLTTIALGLGAVLANAPARAATDAGFDALMGRLQAAWNANDGAAWGREFAEDADSIGIQGVEVTGASVIASRHARVFAGVLKGSQMKIKIVKTRMLGTDYAVLDTVQNTTAPADSAMSAPGAPHDVFIGYVVQHVGDKWVIVHGQNTQVNPAKALLPPPK